MSVILFEHRDFGGRSQRFEPGDYRADRGQLGNLPNDSISSARVPFGRTVDLFEHENAGHGGGMKMVLSFGEHPFVGSAFNDKTSLVRVFPWTDVYLSTDDPMVPSALSFSVQFSSATDGSSQSVSVNVGYDTDDRYYKELRYQLPPGVSPSIWESTRNGSAGWEHSLTDGLLVVRVWVTPRPTLGRRNWVGVRVSI